MAAATPPPTWRPTSDRGIRIDARRAIIPVSLGVLALLAFGLRAPVWILAPASLVVPAFYGWSAWYVHKHLKPFETAFAAALPRGDVDGLWRMYREARLLRWLAPAWVMLPKLGLILSLRGDHRGANTVLEEAYDLAPSSRRADLLGPLARTKYALGDFDALREIATQWRSRALFPGAASLYLAAAYIEDPREDSQAARPLLDEARAGLGTEEKQLKASLEKRLVGPPAA